MELQPVPAIQIQNNANECRVKPLYALWFNWNGQKVGIREQIKNARASGASVHWNTMWYCAKAHPTNTTGQCNWWIGWKKRAVERGLHQKLNDACGKATNDTMALRMRPKERQKHRERGYEWEMLAPKRQQKAREKNINEINEPNWGRTITSDK